MYIILDFFSSVVRKFTLLDVYCSLLLWSLLCYMYNVVWFSCHYYVGCILHCGMVIITMLDVHCSMLYFSLLCWMYIAMFYGGYYYFGCNIINPT